MLFKDLAGKSGAIITDGWTSKSSKVSLTAIIFYFINDNWAMEGRLLAVKKTIGSHTAENLSDILNGVIVLFIGRICSMSNSFIAKVSSYVACFICRYHNTT